MRARYPGEPLSTLGRPTVGPGAAAICVCGHPRGEHRSGAAGECELVTCLCDGYTTPERLEPGADEAALLAAAEIVRESDLP